MLGEALLELVEPSSLQLAGLGQAFLESGFGVGDLLDLDAFGEVQGRPAVGVLGHSPDGGLVEQEPGFEHPDRHGRDVGQSWPFPGYRFADLCESVISRPPVSIPVHYGEVVAAAHAAYCTDFVRHSVADTAAQQGQVWHRQGNWNTAMGSQGLNVRGDAVVAAAFAEEYHAHGAGAHRLAQSMVSCAPAGVVK